MALVKNSMPLCHVCGCLMKRTRIKPISDKQKKRKFEWLKVTIKKATDLGFLCQWCGQTGSLNHSFNPLGGHHIIKRRYRIDTYENCFICHWATCHDYLERHPLIKLEYPDKNEVGILAKYKGE